MNMNEAIDAAIKNNEKLGLFSYSKGEWQKYLKAEYELRCRQKKGTFSLLSVITIPIFVIFIIFIDEGRLAMFLVMLGLIALYAFMAFIVPLISFSLRNKGSGEILVLEKGIMIGKTFHTWDFPMSKLSSVKKKKKPFMHFEVVYDFYDRLGPRSYTLWLPFPKDEKKFIDAFRRMKQINSIDKGN